MGHLTLSFFGAFEAMRGDKSLTHFRSAKVRGLLIYLALMSQQAHARAVLAALFWPDEPETVAKQNLRQSLFRLRKVVGDVTSQKEPYLQVTRATVQFNLASDHRLDVADFLAALERGELETAVSHYHGDLLPGFTCNSLPFDDWLRQERERYHRLALDALFTLTSDGLAQADYQTAQTWARQQLNLEPWREEAHRQLIKALALQGERSAALAHYETCRDILADELGVEPTIETRKLVAHIRNKQAAPATPRQVKRDLSRRRLTIPFVGRKAEYMTLLNAYRRAISEGMQVVMLSGKAGIGKTRLSHHFLEWVAMQGADVLNGRSFETSAGLSYQPLTHLLRQRLERENAPEDLLSDLWLSQLTRLLPELRDRYPDLPEPTQEENTAKQHLFEAVTRLGHALAERQPLVLFIDDWQWADAASLDMLHYAAVRWAEAKAPILLLLTLRQEAITDSPEMQSWLTRLKHDVTTTQIQLSELSRTETEQMIRTALVLEARNDQEVPDSEKELLLTQFSQWLFKETDGQPLFLTEILKALVDEGLVQPNESGTAWQIMWSKLDEQAVSGRVLHGVHEIIQSWLTRITPQANAVLTAVSILAQNATFDHLCPVAGLEEIEALIALDELLSKQLLLETEETSSKRDPIYSFSHQKISEVAYAKAGTARRRILHRQAFKTLQASAVSAADLAHHALQADLLADTIRYNLVAGNEAMALFTSRVAISCYQTAWQVAEHQGWPEEMSDADRQTLFTGLGRAYELNGDWPQAEKIYQAMIAYAQASEAAAMECLALNHLAAVYLDIMSTRQKAIPLLEKARLIAEQHGDRRGLAETEWNLCKAGVQGRKTIQAHFHGEKAVAIARELEHPQLLARCLSMLGYAYTQLRQWEKAETYATEAHQLYIAAGNLVLASDSRQVISVCQIFTGRPQESLATMKKSLAFSQSIENLWGEADCAWKLAHTWLELGDYGKAIRFGKQGIKLTNELNHPFMGVLARSIWGIVQRTLMDSVAAEETLSMLIVDSEGQELLGWVDLAPSELCALHASIGDWKQATHYARQTLALRGEENVLPVGLAGWFETEALLRGGDGDLARAEVERLAGIVGSNKRYQLPLLRSQAVLGQWDGDVAQAISHLQAALALAQEIGLPGEEWPILGALGGLYAELGEDVKAKRAYGEARTIIHRLAESIDDEGLRVGFLTADPVESILKISEGV